MFQYYTALLIVTSSIILLGLTVISFDTVLKQFNKNIFIISYIALLVIYIFEWLAVYLEKTNSNLHFLTTISMSIVLFLAPSTIAIIALGINEKKSKLLISTVAFILLTSFVLGFSGLFSDIVFNYDEQNIYHRGKYFLLHVAIVMFSAITLFINTIKLGIKYHIKNNYILVLVFFIFLGAMFTQFVFDGIWILWISYAIALGFVYIYYSSIVNQLDVLTGILNRKCYESKLYDLNTNAILLIFDVDKFKQINDTKGHAAGDYCLVEISNAIKEVYGKDGYCYRIGGDEFSVILYKNLDLLEALNTKFRKHLLENEYEIELPTVSIGYSYYYPNKSSIQKVIEEADIMMYNLKQQHPAIKKSSSCKV